MTPERYHQVKSLFQLVLEQPPPDRPAFLERACGADRELFSQVRELLRSDSTSEDFLEKPAITPISKVLADAAADLQDSIPSHIGPYAIQRPLGSGGMGAVYLAVRDDQSYQRQVAIKIIRKGMESERILQRFRRERQIIASLDHPNIARLLDGGATDDGRPYIVMEYVEGMPIDAWCDQRRLNIEQRLRLFLQVCEAIHYAHQNLIIHRDIKPGNILVRPDGTVKLLDFGIAKLMNPDLAVAATEKTATSMRLMTPQYASPEQVKGEPVTTASDVYLLGIVLYELLSGHRPYEVKGDATLEVIRAVGQSEPQCPSEAIFRVTEKMLSDGRLQVTKNALLVSGSRERSAADLLKKLQGDIDSIALKSLRRNPAQRYQSAAQLAEDIRSYLSKLPVSSRAESPSYRIKLFLRRNTAFALTAAAAALLLVAVTVVAVWQATIARQERVRAETRFEEVRKMSNALLFDVQEALAPLPGTTPARRLLVQKALEYLGNLTRETGADDTLRRELAAGYIRVGHLQGNPNFANLGDAAGATASYNKAIALLDEILKRDPGNKQAASDMAGALEALADMQTIAGDSAGAIQTLRRAVALREQSGAAPAVLSASRHNLAVALSNTGDQQEALALAQKAHEAAMGLTGAGAQRQMAISHGKIGTVYVRTGDKSHAGTHYREALRLHEQLADSDPVAARPKRDLSFALEDLADFETRAGQPAAAAPLYLRSLQLRRQLAASDPQNLQARRDLAYALLKQGAADDALESFRQLAALDATNVLARRDLALAWEKKGTTLLQAGNAAAAATAYRSLLDASREWVSRDPGNPFANHLLAVGQMKMAEALPRTGDRDGAVSSARSALRILDSLVGRDASSVQFRRDRAFAQWVLGRALAEVAAVQKQPASWKAAADELTKAKAMFAELSTQHQLSGEEREAPQAIENQIKACQAEIRI